MTRLEEIKRAVERGSGYSANDIRWLIAEIEKLKSGQEVFGIYRIGFGTSMHSGSPGSADTHKAILTNIEPLK